MVFILKTRPELIFCGFISHLILIGNYDLFAYLIYLLLKVNIFNSQSLIDFSLSNEIYRNFKNAIVFQFIKNHNKQKFLLSVFRRKKVTLKMHKVKNEKTKKKTSNLQSNNNMDYEVNNVSIEQVE